MGKSWKIIAGEIMQGDGNTNGMWGIKKEISVYQI
jgi:hypothetical protein